MTTFTEVKERFENIARFGANTGSINFCIYTRDNDNLLKDYLSEVFEYISEKRNTFGISLEDANEVVFFVIEEFCHEISDYIEYNIENEYEDEDENDENMNKLLNYIKNKYDYFGEFDRIIIDKLIEETLKY